MNLPNSHIVIQKLEADVRTHIRVEQQLKLHIETIHTKLEDLEQKLYGLEREKQEMYQQMQGRGWGVFTFGV